MRQIIINAIFGGVIGYCFQPDWRAVFGIIALIVVIINNGIPER
jgi:hypothetical protein